jgi:hypothetical protein
MSEALQRDEEASYRSEEQSKSDCSGDGMGVFTECGAEAVDGQGNTCKNVERLGLTLPFCSPKKSNASIVQAR